MRRRTPLMMTGPLAAMRPAAAAAAAAGPAGAGDRRAGERVPLRRGAMLERPGRRRAAVNLLDLSAGGAALLAEGLDVAPGMAAALMLDTALLPATVAAVTDGRVHLAFGPLSPAAEAVVARLLRSALEPPLAA